MKLFYAHTSPYSRKVRLLLLEKGLKIEEQLCNPFDDTEELKAANPLGKIPTLIIDDGTALYDSRVICEYLDSLDAKIRLIPELDMPRWHVRRWEALADGILDAAYNIVMERRRSSSEQSPQAVVNWQASISTALDHVNGDLNNLPLSISLAQLALGVSLGYLDFRLPELYWRNGRERLAEWYVNFENRASMMSTRPK